jgi:hypothetical protein
MRLHVSKLKLANFYPPIFITKKNNENSKLER